MNYSIYAFAALTPLREEAKRPKPERAPPARAAGREGDRRPRLSPWLGLAQRPLRRRLARSFS